MMRYLCIDTSSGSRVALVDGDNVRRAQSDSPRAHAETLAGLIRQVAGVEGGAPLAGSFDAVVVGRGPAPYTGLRAGLVTARTLGRAAGVPVFGVGALDLAARCAFDEGAQGRVLAVLDARRKELYAAQFEAAGPNDVTLVGEVQVKLPADLGAYYEGATLVGPAACLYEIPGTQVVTTAFDVAALARLAQARGDRNTDPMYLRRPDVSQPNPAKSALGK